ncbi:hypothetical protein HY496_03075 [Candidatus Woesearchaeota archaeon]|nr:hypothetical protein [Candidatus Woesearchaeota archaeon]
MNQKSREEFQSVSRKTMGLFIVALILLLPVSSAGALAGTLTITKNTGKAGLEGVIDATDDVWAVEATVSSLQEGEVVAPENVQIKLGTNKKNFNSCSVTDAGAVCQYLEPLTGGITPGTYPFTILYSPAAGTPDQRSSVIAADGAPPGITFVQGNAKQEGNKVALSFTIDDSDTSPCVGLAKVSVVDVDSGSVLMAKDDFSSSFCSEYRFGDDLTYNGFLSGLTGEGVRRLKVVAEDRLGHSATSSTVSFLTDFVPPEVLGLNFTGFGRFLGGTEQESAVVIRIREKSTLTPAVVVATAEHTTLDKTAATSCVRAKEDPLIWECTWASVKVDPASSLAVTVSATDALGNAVEMTVTQDFVHDADLPVVEYFGTLLESNGLGYVKSGLNPIVIKVREQGSGMRLENILANLGQLGGITSPEECSQEGDLFVCYWYRDENFGSASENVVISLVKVVDNVGNSAALVEKSLLVDTAPPALEKLRLFGVSDGNAKSYFQSGDILRVMATVNEKNGLFWMIDLRNAVNDAETQFPATKLNDAGWQTFKGEDVCVQNEEKSWDCTFETVPIKSGLAKNAFVVLKVRDAAGNDAVNWPDAANVEKRSGKNDEGKYAFDILALKDEENPDYWSAGTASPLIDFVDLDAMTFPQRIPIQITLKTESLEAKALAIELVSCASKQETSEEAPVAGSPEISRSVIYGNIFPDGVAEPKPTIMLEFSPVENVRSLLGISTEGTFRGVDVPYVCTLKVYSRLGNTALANAETQEVTIAVPFAFSTLGSIDENLAQKVRDLTESDFMKFANALEYANIAIQWINYVLSFVQVLSDIAQIIDIFSDGVLVNAATQLEKVPVIQVASVALRGSCLVLQEGQRRTWEWLSYVTIIQQVLNCNPPDSDDPTGGNVLGWYGWWQRQVLEAYNVASGRTLLGIPASTPYENIYVSAASICIPGLIYNVHKAREIQCRQILCYAKDVPAGLATYDSCDKLYDLEMCMFWSGPALDLTPLAGFADLGNIIRRAGANPLGLIKTAEIVACFPACFTQAPGTLYACKAATALNKLVSVIDTIIGSIDRRPGLTGTAYCDEVEDLDIDSLTGQTRLPAQ